MPCLPFLRPVITRTASSQIVSPAPTAWSTSATLRWDPKLDLVYASGRMLRAPMRTSSVCVSVFLWVFHEDLLRIRAHVRAGVPRPMSRNRECGIEDLRRRKGGARGSLCRGSGARDAAHRNPRMERECFGARKGGRSEQDGVSSRFASTFVLHPYYLLFLVNNIAH